MTKIEQVRDEIKRIKAEAEVSRQALEVQGATFEERCAPDAAAIREIAKLADSFGLITTPVLDNDGKVIGWRIPSVGRWLGTITSEDRALAEGLESLVAQFC